MARCALLSFLIVFTACVDSPSEPQLGTFPALLSDLGLARIGTHGYEPAWELWTNGAGKDRSVRLPEGGVIGTENRQDWVFPEGTLFTKTFTYRTAESPDIPLPLETRVILRIDGRWETAVYRWREDRTDADLLPGDARVPVPITLVDGTAFTHLIPSRTDCQTCHAPRPSFVLGFSELQLNHNRAGETTSQLDRFAAAGFFDRPVPEAPATILAPDEATGQVMGYVHANCAHCHHAGWPGARVDLSHGTFLGNTINRLATNGDTLVVPGDPEASYLFQRFASGSMPLLGVQRLDVSTRERLRDWILQLDAGT